MKQHLHDQKIAIAGHTRVVPTRVMRAKLKACGASLHATPKKLAGRMDHVLLDADAALHAAALERGATPWEEEEWLDALGWFDGVDARLSELRGLMQGPPTKLAWWRVCTILGLWDTNEDLEAGVEYVEHHAQRWHPELRTIPWAWLKRAESGLPEPRLRIARALHLPTMHGTRVRGTKIHRAFERLPQLRHVSCNSSLDIKHFQALAMLPHLTSLHLHPYYQYQHLHMRTDGNYPYFPSWYHVHFAHLETIYLGLKLSQPEHLQVLSYNPNCPNLRQVLSLDALPEWL